MFNKKTISYLLSLGLVFASLTSIATPLSSPIPSSNPFASQADSMLSFSSINSNEPLPAHQAFRVSIDLQDDNTLKVIMRPFEGYYLYKDTFKLSSPNTSIGNWSAPKGVVIDDPNFGEKEVFFEDISFEVPLLEAQSQTSNITLSFQGCQEDGICYPPMQREFEFNLTNITVNSLASTNWDNPDISSSNRSDEINVQDAGQDTGVVEQAEDQKIANLLSDRPAWQAVVLFLGMGFLLGLTPCVLPMVPILLGLVAGQSKSTSKTTFLASSYVLSHAIVFAIMGIIAAWLGAGVTAIFQSAWAIIPMSILLLSLGFAMLVGIQIQMPAKIQNWASQKGEGGTFSGAIVMGALSSLIIGPCVAPPLAGAVLYLAHTGDLVLGGSALFALGLGMGIPLILAATGFQKFLPKTHKTGGIVNVIFGVSFLVLAGWLATRVVPIFAVFAISSVLLTALAGYQYNKSSRLNENNSKNYIAHAFSFSAILLLGLTIWNGNAPSAPSPTQDFALITSTDQLDETLKMASDRDELVMVDFYADWCTVCQDIEEKTLSASIVQDHLQSKHVILVKIDVTKNTKDDQELMKRFGIIGPPAILFFKDTQEQRDLRLIGFESKEPFAQRIKTAQCRVNPASMSKGEC